MVIESKNPIVSHSEATFGSKKRKFIFVTYNPIDLIVTRTYKQRKAGIRGTNTNNKPETHQYKIRHRPRKCTFRPLVEIHQPMLLPRRPLVRRFRVGQRKADRRVIDRPEWNSNFSRTLESNDWTGAARAGADWWTHLRRHSCHIDGDIKPRGRAANDQYYFVREGIRCSVFVAVKRDTQELALHFWHFWYRVMPTEEFNPNQTRPFATLNQTRGYIVTRFITLYMQYNWISVEFGIPR